MTGEVERLVAPEQDDGDGADASLRPQALDDFIGQQGVRENLAVFIKAARARGEALDHVLFHGPPGLGKTTLAQIVARELGVGFRATSGPVMARAGDLARCPDQPAAARRVCSSTRSTGSIRRSRKSSIRRWRISSST